MCRFLVHVRPSTLDPPSLSLDEPEAMPCLSVCLSHPIMTPSPLVYLKACLLRPSLRRQRRFRKPPDHLQGMQYVYTYVVCSLGALTVVQYMHAAPPPPPPRRQWDIRSVAGTDDADGEATHIPHFLHVPFLSFLPSSFSCVLHSSVLYRERH